VECWRALVNLRGPADLLQDLAPDVSPIYKYYSLLPALILAASMPDPLPPVLPDESLLKKSFPQNYQQLQAL
jgi:hypothetical protein